MRDSKLCLLLILGASALAVAQDGDQPPCLLAKRYKTLHKYEYQYVAESLNAIDGASSVKNGPRATCKVEIEVPQTCSFIVRTTGCALSEVVGSDSDGNPTFGAAPSSNAFADEMERYPLKVAVEGVYDVKLYPEEGETTTALNIKRGIISALAVPMMEEDKNKNMPTVHGMCETSYTINAREDIATDISLERDLSTCDRFVPTRDYTSPLALISGMQYPLSKLVRSSQTCNYKFDNEKKHMTSGSCTEKHILIPFSHKGEYGVTNVGKQELTLVHVSTSNDRIFDHGDNVKSLHMDTVEHKTYFQDKEAYLDLMSDLVNLPETEGERRAHFFRQMVTMVRGMKTETLSGAIPEALVMSRVLTYQVLAQCGTPECSSAIMQILRGFQTTDIEVDATVFALGLVSNPSALLINDMLEMVKYKPSKPIMYALSNVVKRFYKSEGKLIPEIRSVAEYLAGHLGDCAGDEENTFLTLRVIGNMAPAVVPASPALRSSVLQCVNQPAASLAVQQAAIQVYRLTPISDEGRELLIQVLLDSATPLQKRIAAYLVVMKNPLPSELARLAAALPTEKDTQFKSFVVSHMTNILSSTGTKTEELRQKIRDAIQDNEIGPVMNPTKFSRNYRMGSVEGNMIFEGTSYLPKEAMLEMTLKAFGFDIDMMEIGVEGKGFEPTVEALFGDNGFFPDTAMKTMYFVSDNMHAVKEIVQSFLPGLRNAEMKRQISQNFMKEVGQNLNVLMRKLQATKSPEAMMYLRLFGNELGYLKINELGAMTYSAALMFESMFKMFPTNLLKGLMTKADNTIFAHYIFMDNDFFLPTVTGVPLKITLSGTFTPGVKAGFKMARDMSEVAFMPSAGVEFTTHFGAYIPEYLNSGLEMHSNIFHESGLQAKISMGRDHVKLTIPAPKSPTKLIKMTNTLVAVNDLRVVTLPPMVTNKVDVSECTPFFAGMKYCTALQYMDAFSQAPYFPITGDSKFALELHPTGEVTEYTATLAYELLKEGDEGKHKIDSVKFVLRAEGAEPTEARAIMKYNRRKHTVTADIQIPNYDVEAGLRLGVVDGNTRGKGTHSIYLDLLNKKIPQLSLIGRANLEVMKKGMLQIQLKVPTLKVDASVTADMKREEELELKLKSEVKVMDAVSKQEIAMKYDDNKVEVGFKSDMNTDVTFGPFTDLFEKYTQDLLDTKVGQTDMKISHIFKKFGEAANNYMEKYGAEIPYLQNFRVPNMPEISLPETLFLNTETKAVYYFNKERFTLAIPVPLGGKSTKELNFPPALTTPHLSLPEFGLEIVSMEIPIPEVFVPERLTLTIPLFGKAEVSTQMKSNLYDFETSIAAGKDVMEAPSYSAKFDAKGTSQFEILSFKIEGSGLLTTTDSLKAQMKGSLSHKFLEASVSFVEDATITDKINVHSHSKIEATSPFSLNVDIDHNSLTGINAEKISVDSSFKGTFKAGPLSAKTVSNQTFYVIPFKPNAKFDSLLELESTIVQAKNRITASFVDGDLLVVSNTNAFEDTLTHSAEFSFTDSRASLKCHSSARALGMKIHHKAEASAGAGKIALRVETNADHREDLIYSLLTSSLDVNGLTVNSDANIKLLKNTAMHKATLRMDKNGLVTSGTNTLRSPLSLDNTFNVGLDTTKATLSFNNKAALFDLNFDNGNDLTLTLSSLILNSKAKAQASEYASYTHDVAINLTPYTASAKVNNNLKLLAANIINDAQLLAGSYKIDLTGSLKTTYDKSEIKHSYQINYADMTAIAKCSTIGNLFGTYMSHTSDLEIIGLAAKFTNDARFNSQLLRFDHNIRSSIVPFDFNLDAIFNADGDMALYGKHSAQLYGKFLLRAQPLAFATSHECRASVSQVLDNGLSLETTLDNKMDAGLSMNEQKAIVSLKSKINNHAFNQDLSVYNTAEGTGMSISANILTNIINAESTDNQEFGISGFLKYDKNTNCHIIQFPLLENVPVFLEGIKDALVGVAELVRDYIKNEQIGEKLEALPQRVSEFVAQLNIEGKVIQLKEYISDLTPKTLISMEDVDAAFRNLKVHAEKMITEVTFYIQHYFAMMEKIIVDGSLPETVASQIQELLNAINEKYDIKGMVLYLIETVKTLIQQIDLEKLRGTSVAFLNNIEKEYQIVSNLKDCLNIMKQSVDNFDLVKFVAELKDIIKDIDISGSVKVLTSQIPIELFNEMMEYIQELIQDLKVFDKINALSSKIRDFIVKLEADKKIQVIFEKLVEVIKQFRIEETLNTVARMVKDANIPAKCQQFFKVVIDYMQSTEVKDMIQDLKSFAESIMQKITSLDYKAFVDKVNKITGRCTTYVHDLIRALEIPKKLEAAKDFASVVLTSAKGFSDRLRKIRVAEIVTSVKELMDQAIFEDIRRVFEEIKKEVTNIDFSAELDSYVTVMRNYYKTVLEIATDICQSVIDGIRSVFPEQKIIGELQQIYDALTSELTKYEVTIPSFTVPLTDLVVPSVKFNMDKLQQVDIPTQLDIPEFTILGFHTIKATTVSFDDIKQRILQVIDFILNYDFKIIDIDAFFGDLKMNYLPSMPEINLSEITLPEISFPTLPHFPVDKLVKSLSLPEIELPKIPSDIIVPCFGKLSAEIRFNTPIYTVKTSAELQNATEKVMTPQFKAMISSQGTSPSFEILNYKVDSTAQIALPKMSRVVLAETLKINHLALVVDHLASLSLYGLSGQAQAKTAVKVNTPIYNADVTNHVFVAMEEGMAASLETNYKHLVDLPIVSVKSDAIVTQKAIVRQDGYALTLTVDNVGKSVAQESNHNSTLYLSLSPSLVTLTFSGNTDLQTATMKQQVTAEASPYVYKFNLLSNMKAPIVKSSVVSASGNVNFMTMKADLKANHDTELTGVIRGLLSNGMNIVASPDELVADFQNKINSRVTIFGAPTAKIDLRNDYSAALTPNNQKLNTIYTARLNQAVMTSNLTVDNNRNEAGAFIAMDGNVNLDFLNNPISVPAIQIPFVDMRTPAIKDVNLYKLMGLKHLMISPKQNVDLDAKIVYQKKKAAPIAVIMSLIEIPPVGDLITELSFKSSVISVNVNTGLNAADDLVFRLGATTTSVFEGLKAKLDGTASLTSKRGIKLANSLSLENRHIEGTHDSTFSVSSETLEAATSVASVARISLPILSLELNQRLVGDTKSKTKAHSTVNIKGNYNIPVVKAVGKANTDWSLKLERTSDDISIETAMKANVDGKVLDDYIVLGVLDSDVNLFLNNGLRSTSKVIADVKLNHGTTKVINFDLNDSMSLQASLSRMYATLKHLSNNELNLFTFNTNGKHFAQATVDIAPVSSLTADIEINLSQPSTLGDFTISEKTVVDVTVAKQKISTNGKFISPLYTSNFDALLEGNAPVFKGTLKSSATSTFVILDYDMDASSTVNFENAALNVINKLVLKHADLNMDANHVIDQSTSVSRQTLNVDITSPTFTDVNLRYAARRDVLSASLSAPSIGFLGLQLNGRVPSQLSGRVYGRYPSAPEADVDIFVIKSSSKNANRMNLQITYNTEAPKIILSELKQRVPSIVSAFTEFLRKYQITSNMDKLKNVVVTRIGDVYNAAINYDVQMSQLSIFFRNTIVQYQQNLQVIVDAIVKLLRETKFQLPGSDEMTTLPEVLKKMTDSIATTLDKNTKIMYQSMEIYYNSFVEKISTMKVSMPVGDAVTVGQIFQNMKTYVRDIMNGLVAFVKNMESLDTALVKMSETMSAVVGKTQQFVDSIKSDYLDQAFLRINDIYRNIVTLIKVIVDKISALDTEQLNNAYASIIDMFIQGVDQANATLSGWLTEASPEARVKLTNGRLEIDLPFAFQQ
ncbi:apolipoprotein Bb, tandem duplicate 1 [Hippocampus zosterae]|uniref:apolipoprotein Bb, tandem duplicate 1 n=1 Tax=Hippocampus zosterae TaxID=109293 RepID=UPI00223E0D66|nr:apolipoprotein Bb, tandem duplicate 1 [Hippocampus zosterae]XP_051909563.1 apolipoprotein Bb, tandem duplicate 1 [Hippocampus zosterae]